MKSGCSHSQHKTVVRCFSEPCLSVPSSVMTKMVAIMNVILCGIYLRVAIILLCSLSSVASIRGRPLNVYSSNYRMQYCTFFATES